MSRGVWIHALSRCYFVVFRAPELFEVPSNCVIDEKTDVWSLGCTLYAMAYGKAIGWFFFSFVQ